MKSSTITRTINVRSNDYVQAIDYVASTNMVDLLFTLNDFSIPEGSAAKVYVTRPDSTIEYDNATVDTDANTVLVDVVTSMFSVAGFSDLRIVLTKDTQKLVSFSVPVVVSTNDTETGGAQAANVLGVLDTAVNNAAASAKAADDSAKSVSALSGEIVDLERTVGILARDITSWAAVQKIVRDGLASKYFAVGDQLQCKRGDTVLTWDVLGFDHDVPVDTTYTHSMTLGLHDCINNFQYDAAEAMYYAAETLPAGTYNYTPGVQSGWVIGDGVTRQFTLANAVPAGGQICINGGTGNATTTATTYASRTTTTALETAAVTVGSGGTALANINHIHRIPYGSNNWEASAVRQWLNSDAAAGAWWQPKTNFDRPSSAAASMAGFLNGIDADFLDVIGKVTKRTTLNAVNEGGGYKDSQERFFLLSRSEVYMTNNNGISEGAPYDYYKNFSSLSAQGDGEDSNRIKRIIGNTSAAYWWLRSPGPLDTRGVYLVPTGGGLNYGTAISSSGLAPACNIV